MTKEAYEICVVCGCFVPVKKSLPVDGRKEYVVGVGQLCDKCFETCKPK